MTSKYLMVLIIRCSYFNHFQPGVKQYWINNKITNNKCCRHSKNQDIQYKRHFIIACHITFKNGGYGEYGHQSDDQFNTIFGRLLESIPPPPGFWKQETKAKNHPGGAGQDKGR